MSTNTLLANFEVLTEAPNGIDRIREVILGLAVQGKLFKDTDLNKWQNGVSLKEFGRMIRGITYAKTDSSKELVPSFVPLLGAANVQGSINYEGLTFVSSSLIKPDQYLKDGDILICMSSGSKHLVGKTGVVKNPSASSFGAFCGVFRILEEKNRDYLALFFKSPGYRTAISDASRGIGINNLRVGDIESIELLMPPEVEQKRIVAKVDELMALCDQLELQQQSRDNLRVATRKSAIDAISTATTTEEIEMAWKRIENNWEVIADTVKSIGSLRSLILKLAVLGKIVPQDDREPKIIDELILAGLSDADKLLSTGSNLPANWVLAGFRQIGRWVGGNGFPTDKQGGRNEEILFCKVSDMNLESNSKYIFETVNSIDSRTAKEMRVTPHAPGTVIFPKIGGAIATNKRRLLIKPTVIDNNCMGVAPSFAINPEWLYLLLQSIDLTKYQSGTSIPSISQRVLDEISFGVPPSAEQKRIVEKVEELMAICDRLESGLKARSELAEKFARSVVSTA